ncbi:protein EARLY FLOWERING 4-like [Gastrolobium bilobum]|uniref:protein EARLY FLOWERING 4-like n=1 Tax=Gastrolobium bilobum TaxID=150636 RepID=UPI002AAF7E29|nr:protein EARLY FLOWERING 4-like [Gastrolobium bilobum]
MTSLHSSSSSAAESTVEEDRCHHRQKPPKKPRRSTTDESQGEVVDGEPEVWASFNESFREVQSVLDRNRLLIQQVNENQRSRLSNNMVKNVSLIQELNGNMSKVVSLYSDLNSNFSTACQQHSKNTTTRDQS